MEVVKDTPFEFGYQVWQVRPPQPSLMVMVKGTYAIVPNGVCTLAETQATTSGEVYWDDDPNNSVQRETDFALMKNRGECFLVGTCHPPGGSAATSAVAFRVGAVRKAMAVIGDRHWSRGLVLGASKPAPFTSMPLRWERAFGGPGCDKNPNGAGIAAVTTAAGTVVPLPNIEDPNALITEPGARPEPVCASPIAGTWKSRAKLMGTFDQRWLDTRWPWFPEDFSWDFFNAAPVDQRIAGYWRGDEEIAGQNLHPEHASFRARLPGLRARAFLEIRQGGRVVFAEVPLHLDTITLDTDAMQVHCQWRGLLEVPSEDLHEIATLFYVHEPLDQARSLDECHAWLERKRAEAAEEDAAFEAEAPPADEAPPAELPAPAPPPHPMAEVLKLLHASAAGAAAKGDNESIAQALALSSLAATLQKPEEPEPPAEIKPSALRAAMRADGVPVPEALEQVPDPPDAPGPDAPPQDALPDEPPGLTREAIHARVQRGETFAGEDLTGADLSGLHLAGADFSEAILTRANFTRSTLEDAKFDGTLLPQADFTEASLLRASFKGADLSAVVAPRCLAEGAVFDDAVAPDGTWSGTRFAHASFAGADFSRGVFEACDFQDVSAPAGDFTHARMDGGDFRRAKLVDARFEGTSAKRSKFDDADLTKLRASEAADLSESSLRGVTAVQSKWDSAVLNKCNFSLSDLAGADFAAARLVQANFTGSVLRGARFQGASLVGATIVKSDALESNFEGADLSHADMRGSNFFGSQFWKARVEFAQLELANVTRTHLAKPRKR